MNYLKNVNALLCIFMLISGNAFAADLLLSTDEEACAEIISISGSVEVLVSGEDEYEDAQEDMFLKAGDKIRTGQSSYTELAFDEDGENIVRINADTYAIVTMEEGEKLELFDGEVLATINNLSPGSRFEIRTPTAVCGARGTDWVTQVEEESTEVSSLEGTPYVKGFGADGKLVPEETVISPGYATSVLRLQRPRTPVRIPEDRQKRWDAMKNESKKRARDVLGKRKMEPERDRRLDRMRNKQNERLERKRDDRGQVNKAGEGAFKSWERDINRDGRIDGNRKGASDGPSGSRFGGGKNPEDPEGRPGSGPSLKKDNPSGPKPDRNPGPGFKKDHSPGPKGGPDGGPRFKKSNTPAQKGVQERVPKAGRQGAPRKGSAGITPRGGGRR
ncbi:MAG: FecR family protein [Candidatus Omnitrophota bacterium]